MGSKKLLVCDLDNTLYDWVSYFVPSFYAMVDTAVKITGCDREKLLDDFLDVHRRHGDSEQPFALLETETIKNIYRNCTDNDIIRELDPAFHAFNSSRRNNLKLHAHVRETLETLNETGVKLVAHTESKLYGVVDRLNRLDLFQFFQKVYCRERSDTPHPVPELASNWLERVPKDRVVELSDHQAKPDPSVLLEICAREGVASEDASYVGDSVARDILMAKRANVFSIWAAYGAQHDPKLYKSLVRISHRTSEEIALDEQLTEEAKNIRPDYVAQISFAEVLSALNISPSVQHVSSR